MLRRYLAVLLFVAAAAPLSAQVTFGAQTFNNNVVTPGAPTTTVAHTTGAGGNRILLVAVHMNIRLATGATVTNVTYGGVGLTQAAAISDGGPDTRTELWYMLNPPAGAANVVSTVGGMAPGEDVEVLLSATTFSGVDQVAPSTNTAFGQNDPASVTVTGTLTTDVVLDFITVRETVDLDADPGQVEGYNNSTGGGNDDLQAGVSGRAGAAGNTVMSWDVSANRRWTQIGVRLRSAIADVEIAKFATPDPVAPGGTLTYTIQARNNGPSTATGVTVTDTLPAGVTFINSSTTLGSCAGTGPVTCTLGTMTNGQTATITINVTAPLTGGLIGNNSATVTTSSTDPAGSNTSTANAWSLVQAAVCGTQPGKDGPGGTLAGIVNSYWPGTTATVAAGATGLTVGARRGNAVSITPGDLLLIIQMQDAAIDSNNDDRYGNGNGVAGGTTGIGSGYTNANQTGRYEYVIATNTVGAAGGALTFTGVNGSGGTIYSYNNAAATATMGQRRYQVVRVPQYTTATLGPTLTASSWNGTTGGILALDIAGDLALGSTTVDVTGLGFRGGAGLDRDGGGGGATVTDYRALIASLAHGSKGEGIAGTPEWVLDAGVNADQGPQGYPNGDFARGAPGTAGGGGTDTDVALNQQNSGGGGGGNFGRGGQGGNAWQTNLPRGGFGGAPFFDSPGRVILGGGGGAGARNNSSTIAGAGAAGGGIVLIRAGRLTGTGTITANGAAAYNLTANDGGGGGGAGGSIVILARGGGIGGLTLQANGGRGGDAWATQAPGAFPGERHGPGGGGGGGYIAVNGTPASSSVTGGNSGITTTANDTFGAQPGQPGAVVLTASFDQITGVQHGCLDLTVSISDSPDPVFAGNNITYTQTVTNNSTVVPAQNATITQTTPPGTVFVSMTPPAGWTCGTLPSVGGTGTITCTANNPLAPSTTTGNFVLVVDTDPALADGSTITQPVSVSASNPETNTANNSASAVTTVGRRVDIAVVKDANDPGPDLTFSQGETVTYSITVTNNGPSRATNVVVTDAIPAGITFGSVSPGGPTCSFAAGTVTCTYAAMNPGATNNISITGTINTNTVQITNTANSTRTETDTDPTNNSDSATINVVAPTVVHMLEMQAVQDSKGKVQLSWTTSFEAENLGFNVYRQTAAGREKLNRDLVAGSALFTKRGTLDEGGDYRWNDKVKDVSFVQYYVEDVDLHGVKTLHGPITPVLVGEVPDTANTDSIADLGSVGGVFVSPRGIGAPKYPAIRVTRAQLEKQWDLASQAAVKLMVTTEGLYRVRFADLIAAGFAPGKKLALFAEGIEQPINVTDDAVEFYGIGIDTPSGGARAYWLVNDKGNDVRIKKEKAKKGAAELPRTSFTVERMERSVFFTALVNNGERENFFGPVITASATVAQSLSVENIDRTGGAASLEISLTGATDGAHAVQITVNGQNAGTASFTNMSRKVTTLSVPLAMLADGANAIGLRAQNGAMDVSVLEHVRLTYPHRLVADNDALKVSAAAGSTVTVSGFTSSTVRAIDVTDPADPIEIEVESVAAGTFRVVAPASGMRSILLLGDSRVAAPAQVLASKPSTWNARTNAADMVIVSARPFIPAAEPLKARRDAEGVSTVIVDVQDLYDEFGFGERSPGAVREFLSRTREWSRAPKYVLLLGDASLDPRNYLNLGAVDYVPTKLVNTAQMKTSSDDWLADFSNTGVPELAIGRLPARTLAEAQTMVRKIAERATAGNEPVNFVADPSTTFDFAGGAASLAALVPPSSTTSVANRATAASFDSLMLTYFGHGSTDQWSAGRFRAANVRALRNTKLPVVAAMTCLNGYYHDMFLSSFAELLMTNAQGGAVAVWASSTLTEPKPQLAMTRELFRRLFAGATLGEAAMAAKAATTDADVRRSWILFGDPSMKLK
jgi:uncharacterized repeat protein (TIGR01451 family)